MLFLKPNKGLAVLPFLNLLFINVVSSQKIPPVKAKVTTEAKWIQDSVDCHNKFRSLHKSQPLVLNNTLSEISQAWSNHLLKLALESLKKNKTVFFDHNHEVNTKYRIGENLYYIISYYGKLNASLAVTLWYNEIKDYDFTYGKRKKTSHPNSLIGHFTQLVWNETSQIGTAYAASKLPNDQTITFVTANYWPAGNVIWNGNDNFREKFYIKNVLPPISEPKVEETDYQYEIKDRIFNWNIQTSELTTPLAWIQTAVDKHNEYRRDHFVPALQHSVELSKVAQSWANFLLEEAISDFNSDLLVKNLERNKNPAVKKARFGENLMYYITDDSLVDPTHAVRLWYEEKKYFNFETLQVDYSASKKAKTDHFEQIIWKSTTQMGIAFASAKAENGQKITFVVAHYYPAKSWHDNRIDNILKSSATRGTIELNVRNVYILVYVLPLCLRISMIL